MILNKWMKEISSSKELFRLNMVGAHDCATQYVQFSHISKCQDLDIFSQLMLGVRGLDIRVSPSNERLKLVHGVAKAFNTSNHFSEQMDLEDVLEQCYSFLKANQSECIVFQFKNDSNKEMEECFDILYNVYIKKARNMWFLENRSPLLGESRGKLVLLRRCKKYEDKNYLLGAGIDFSNWVEQDERTPEPLYLDTKSDENMIFVIQDRFKYKPEPRWKECILPFLNSIEEYNSNYIINYISTAGGLKGPYLNSRYINPKFMEYPLKKGCYYGMIYMDFPDKKIVRKVIETNEFK